MPEYDGKYCPHCDSEAIHRYFPEANGTDEVVRDCECRDCGASWIDTFLLDGFEGLEKGEL